LIATRLNHSYKLFPQQAFSPYYPVYFGMADSDSEEEKSNLLEVDATTPTVPSKRRFKYEYEI